MNPINPRSGFGVNAGTQALFDEGLRKHMLRIYNYMAIGLVMTGLVAFVVGTTPALYVPIFSSPLKWVVMLAPIVARPKDAPVRVDALGGLRFRNGYERSHLALDGRLRCPGSDRRNRRLSRPGALRLAF